MLQVVLDTNVVVSSLLSRTGAPAGVIDNWKNARFAVVLSQPILAEIRTTLRYTHIRGRLAAPGEAADALIALLEQDALLVCGEADVAGAIPEDATDEKFLACAIEAHADVIVSGDQHLLRLGCFHGVRIITARQLLDELGLE